VVSRFVLVFCFFFSSRRRHTRFSRDWSSDVCSSDLHAAGALFVSEAGGIVTHWDCSPYRVGGPGKGVLIAAGRREWDLAAEVLLGPAAGLVEAERHAA